MSKHLPLPCPAGSTDDSEWAVLQRDAGIYLIHRSVYASVSLSTSVCHSTSNHY